MRAGPKGTVKADPLELSGLAAQPGGRRERFIGEYLVTPRGVGAGKPFKLRPFQREIIAGAFAPGIRTALVWIPRANGKTMLGRGAGAGGDVRRRQTRPRCWCGVRQRQANDRAAHRRAAWSS